jgi:hypothetical protein
MDFFHVLQAIFTKKNMFPNPKYLGIAAHHVCLLADLGDYYHDRAYPAVSAFWKSKGWTKFEEYFTQTWERAFPKWWSSSLGFGTPRTTGGTEGTWPTVHVLLRGKLEPQRLVEQLVALVCPALQRNQGETLYNRQLEDHPWLWS